MTSRNATDCASLPVQLGMSSHSSISRTSRFLLQEEYDQLRNPHLLGGATIGEELCECRHSVFVAPGREALRLLRPYVNSVASINSTRHTACIHRRHMCTPFLPGPARAALIRKRYLAAEQVKTA